MLKFFRRIRHKLLAEGSFRKYLIYAIGEIVLVVVGILIALSINNWNQQQIDHKEEQRVLSSISVEMSDLAWKTKRGLATYEDVLDASNRLLFILNNPEQPYPIDSLNKHLAIITNRWMFGKSNVTNIYHALVGAGELRLLQSDSLSNALTLLDRNILLLSVYEEFQTQFVDEQLYPFLNNYIDGVDIAVERASYRDKKWERKTTNPQIRMEQGHFPSQSEVLLSSQKFSNLLVEHINRTASLIPIYERLIGFVEQVESLTDSSQ